MLILIITATAFAYSVTQAANSTWTLQSVDSKGTVGSKPSIALDSKGTVHISYSKASYGNYVFGSSFIMYASLAGSNWTIQTVGEGIEPSLALDSNDNPHISYGDGDLKYASWNGSGWNIQIIENYDQRSDEYHSCLALDSEGYPHISYTVFSNPKDTDDSTAYLKYAAWNGSSWQTQIIDEALEYAFSSLALDSSGSPHVVYTYKPPNFSFESTYSIKYASWNGTDWNIQVITQDGVASSLFLDKNGNPHVSFSGRDGLTYATWTGLNWNTQSVDKSAGYPSLVLDSVGNPNICYLKGDFVMYAFWNGTGWSTSIVGDNPDAFGQYGLPSLVLDASGNPHISYGAIFTYVGHGQSLLELKYAYASLSSPSKITETISFFWTAAGVVVASAVIVAVVVLILRFNIRKSRKSLSPL